MRNKHMNFGVASTLLATVVLAGSGLFSPVEAAATERYEVWALDQADTVTGGGGGLLYIWSSEAIARSPATARPAVIDLAVAAEAAGCPVAKRPHMVLGNHTGPATHAIIANVGSGDVQFMNVESRTIVGCVAGTGNAHAAVAAPDNSMVIVADLGGQTLHKIETDYSNDRFSLVESLSLDTPELKASVGTDAVKPVCLNFTGDSRFAYVTLAGGGLLVVDVGTGEGDFPMQVKHAYPRTSVPGIGCGAFRLPDERMVTNGESGAKGGDDFLFVFDTRETAAGRFPDPQKIDLPGEDTHSAVFCVDAKGNEHMLTVMRVSNEINVVELNTGRVAATHSIASTFSPDPKPDVGERVDDRLFVTLRGANPLSAISALKNAARTPGVAALRVSEDCHSIGWTEADLMPMNNNPEADPHGLNVFRR